MESNQYQFGPFLLNARERRLTRSGEAVHLQPKAFDVLLHLLEHAGCLITKQGLLDAVWKDAIVTENSLTNCIRQIRVALEDSAEHPAFIETVPVSGYRFIGEVTSPSEASSGFVSNVSKGWVLVLATLAIFVFAYTQRPDVPASGPSPVPGGAVPSQGSIAVLPFANLSEDPGNEYLADGLSEEIRNLLASIPTLKVIGRTSSFMFKGQARDLRQIGRTLGVENLLEGSVRRSGERIRITAQLIDASNGSQLWSESYQRNLDDVFDIQDDVAHSIIDALQIHVGVVPTRGRPTGSSEAYALFLKAKVAANVADWRGAETLLLRAVEIDPNFAEAYEMLSLVYWVIPGGTSVIESQTLLAEMAARALSLDPDLVLARAYHDAAIPGPYMRLRALEAFERAARERPDAPLILEGLTFLLMEFGYLQEALAVAEQYVEIDPLAELANTHWPLALYATGQRKEAAAALGFVNQSAWQPHLYRWAIEGVNLVEHKDELAVTHLESWLRDKGYPDPTWFRELVAGARDPETGAAFLDRRIPTIVSAMAERDAFDWRNGLISLYLVFGHLDRYYELILDSGPVDTSWHPGGAHLWRSAIFTRLGATAHPGYLEFADRMGVDDVWEKRGPPDFCAKVAEAWVCR